MNGWMDVRSQIRSNIKMRVELFYDCLSPFSYLAFKVLRRYKPVWGFDLQLRPTLLGGVMVCLNTAYKTFIYKYIYFNL